MRESWWGRQLQREDLLTTLEQGRRVEVELFQEKHRGLRTMGELLKARMFGATEWAINLRKRMTKFQGGGAVGLGSESRSGHGTRSGRSPEPSQGGGKGHGTQGDPAAGLFGGRTKHPATPPEPHSWPCDDPFCQPCEDAVKRLLRDVGVLPRKGRAK
jgi:hypothetical protein